MRLEEAIKSIRYHLSQNNNDFNDANLKAIFDIIQTTINMTKDLVLTENEIDLSKFFETMEKQEIVKILRPKL